MNVGRREFIGGAVAAAAWPWSAESQPSIPTVGFLHSAAPGPSAHFVAVFRDGLKQSGFVEGKNIQIEFRWAEGRYDELSRMAQGLVRLNVSAIFTGGGALPTLAAKEATTRIPIVFEVGDDPIKAGLVDSLNRPSGNVTGSSFFGNELGQKRLELIRQTGPHDLIAVLINPKGSTAAAHLEEVQNGAAPFKQKLMVVQASSPDELEKAFAEVRAQHVNALVVNADPFFFSQRGRIVEVVRQLNLPSIYYTREYVEDGGLMSYGTSIANATRDAAVYIGKILKGARVSDLPVLLPTRFEFVVNTKTAQSLGLTLPPTLLALADEVVE